MAHIGPLLSPLLIGRDDILDLAGRRISEAADGRGQFLLLAGEAGIGKTRLVTAIERLAKSRGFRTSAGAGSVLGGNNPRSGSVVEVEVDRIGAAGTSLQRAIAWLRMPRGRR